MHCPTIKIVYLRRVDIVTADKISTNVGVVPPNSQLKWCYTVLGFDVGVGPEGFYQELDNDTAAVPTCVV
jgi:hypothetical protein